MTKVVNVRLTWIATIFAALALAALPAVAVAQDGNTTNTTQNNNGNANQDGDQVAAGDDSSNRQHQTQKQKTNINQANCIAGRDCNINQSINSNVTRVVQGAGHVHRRVAVAPRRVFFVRRVALARTGFDAWIPAGIGALSLAGGLGLLARRRTSA